MSGLTQICWHCHHPNMEATSARYRCVHCGRHNPRPPKYYEWKPMIIVRKVK